MPTYFLIAVSVVGWGLWGVLDKAALKSLHPAQAQIVAAGTGLLTVPVCLLLLRQQGVSWKAWELSGSALAVAAGMLTSVASVAYLFALRARDATWVVGLTAAYPLVTCVVASVFLQERLTASRAAGVLLVAAGVWALSR